MRAWDQPLRARPSRTGSQVPDASASATAASAVGCDASADGAVAVTTIGAGCGDRLGDRDAVGRGRAA